jgi:3',5'-cyclic AMP phosphodiesterase CpdA
MGSVLHFSDIHFGCENVEAVAAALDYAHATKPTLVLISGDVTQIGAVREFEAAAKWLAAMPEPVFVIPGNHDTPYWNLIARMAWPWKRFEDIIKHPSSDHEYDTDEVAVRGINTARAAQLRLNWSKGAIDLDQVRKAAHALKSAPPRALKIIACHHPLIEMDNTPMTGGVKYGCDAAEIFADAGVDLVLTGHVHVPFALEIPVADHRSHGVGAGTLSRRERGTPPSFNHIDWDEKEIRIAAKNWTGSAFETGPAWRYKRRQPRAA